MAIGVSQLRRTGEALTCTVSIDSVEQTAFEDLQEMLARQQEWPEGVPDDHVMHTWLCYGLSRIRKEAEEVLGETL